MEENSTAFIIVAIIVYALFAKYWIDTDGGKNK